MCQNKIKNFKIINNKKFKNRKKIKINWKKNKYFNYNQIHNKVK